MTSRKMTFTQLALCIGMLGIILPARSGACTMLTIGSATSSPPLVFAKSFDWYYGHGRVFTNARNVEKTAMLDIPRQVPAKWVSKFGSVTFTQYGRDFPLGGMNEAGLVVELLWLDTTIYPPRDTRPTVNEFQWLQYQLDNYASVSEIIAHASELRTMQSIAKAHYMACDANAECAVFENVAGQLVIHSGTDLPVHTLTNHTYDESLAFLKNYVGFGGSLPIPKGRSSEERYVRGTTLAQSFPAGGEPISFAFDTLSRVAMGNFSQWNMVYDPRNVRLSFRSQTQDSIKTIDLKTLNFSCKTPNLTADVNAAQAGPLVFEPYTSELNRALIAETAGKKRPEISKQIVSLLTKFPDTTSCKE